jgi:hippurate hydrolase
MTQKMILSRKIDTKRINNMFEKLYSDAEIIKEYIINIRRKIHQYSETGFDTPNTVKLIETELKKLNIQYNKCGKSGIVAYIGNGKEAILLRADFDALPIKEESNLSFASNNGNCHACGHDMHTAMLLGAAKILKAKENKLTKKVLFMFQPAEEILKGCNDMIENGLLQMFNIKVAIMMHVLSGTDLKSGDIIVCSGGISAPSAEFFEIEINGKSAHGAAPQNGIDALNIAAHTVINLQSIHTRELPSNHKSALTIGMLQSGNASNIISDKSVINGTFRAFDTEIHNKIKNRIIEISSNTAKVFGGVSSYTTLSSCPPLKNYETLSKTIGGGLKNEVTCHRVLYSEKDGAIGGSEDFSYLSQLVPSLMLSLSAGSISEGYIYPLHHPKVRFNEEIMPFGSAVYAYCAIKLM